MLVSQAPAENLLLVWMRKLAPGVMDHKPIPSGDSAPSSRAKDSSFSETRHHTNPGSVLLRIVFILNEESTGDIVKQYHGYNLTVTHQ